MDQKFRAQIKEKLLAEKARLEEELAGFTARNIHNVDDFEAEYPDFGTEADANAQEVAAFEDRLALERTLEGELRDVKNTLQKIQNDSYGVCKYCGKEIDTKRLLARPTSSACVECKKKFKGEI